MAYVYVHNQESLRNLADYAAENARQIWNSKPLKGRWISYFEEGIIAVVYVSEKDIPQIQSRIREFKSPFPGLIAPKNNFNSIAINARQKTIGFFSNNNIKNIYGFHLERGAGIILSNHTQSMVAQPVNKSKLQNLSYSIDYAVLYRPSEFDNENDIKTKIAQLIGKLKNSGLND